MNPAWHKYLSSNVPRYTSYPSALGFSENVGPAEYSKALEEIGQYEPVSLYLHIPFCKQLCWYCGCNMRVENSYERIERYVDDLISEIEYVGARLRGRGSISYVHFGGGTPNILRIADTERLLAAIEQQFGLTDATPVAMEVDPRLCNTLQAAHLAKLGINRFSLGVQDFDPDVQDAINRVQSYELVEQCIDEMREAGVPDISLDVLYGLPDQKICSFRRTIDQVISLHPDRVSLFGYAHMPSKFRHQQLIDSAALPDRSMRVTLAEAAASQLMAAGYERIGFDHFALPETPLAKASHHYRLNRNFQGFTEDPAQVVLGFGTSAISSVHGLIVQNTKSLREYPEFVAERGLASAKGLVSTLEEEDLGDWIRRLLCDLRASLPRYYEITGLEGEEMEQLLSELYVLHNDGVIRFEDDQIVINENAKALSRSVAAVFDPQVSPEQKFASPAV